MVFVSIYHICVPPPPSLHTHTHARMHMHMHAHTHTHTPLGLGEGSSDSGIHRRGQCTALVEDMALRGFSPLVRAQETLQFNSANTTSKQKQVDKTGYSVDPIHFLL